MSRRIQWFCDALGLASSYGSGWRSPWVGIGGPILLWLLSCGSSAGEVTLDLWKRIGGAVAAVIGDAIGRAVGAMLGSGDVAHWIGCPSPQITGAATGAVVGYGIWLFAFLAAGLFPNSHEILKWLLLETSQTELVWAMHAVTMAGAAIGSAGAALRAIRQETEE